MSEGPDEPQSECRLTLGYRLVIAPERAAFYMAMIQRGHEVCLEDE
jgi:hypothetical protein